MTTEQWPTDEKFRRFASRIADAVMFSQQAGTRLAPYRTDGNAPDENCPLGCLVGAKHPVFIDGAAGISYDDGRAFVAAFDKGEVTESPYNRLGRAYRERFVK
jgi:hypothetical protein